MARSDNVIRCGLTPKFKDVEVLCDSLAYDTTQQVPSEGVLGAEGRLYRPPVSDFEVRVNEVEKDSAVTIDGGVDSGSVLLVLEGEGKVKSGEESVDVGRGESLYVSANSPLVLEGGGEGLKVVRAMRNLK